ncbi:MAG: DUF4160 domain-containing protein [Bacteroides sp.]|nr:DUF4160 domain-containing protein [Prevotella sp.]MCM1407411.1 DUF4160 domain-containing protein [Treponema brennaborense]MCM1469901.1 DUF4160 domain-containing protein [Bacteroides sp.]
MPTISMFYGIIIRMFNNNEHNPPHFHASYGEFKAIFLLDGTLKEGAMPQKQTRLIQAWTEIHQEELKADWELAKNEEALFKIEPLK